MKKLLSAVLPMALAIFAGASELGPGGPVLAHAGNPYIHFIGHSGDPIYTTSIAAFSPTSLKYQAAYESIAFLYHPLSAGSLTSHLPASIQPFLPPESWACTIGFGGLQGTGINQPNARGALGCGLNLLDSVRGWASSLLSKSSNQTAKGIAAQIAPTAGGPLSLYASRLYTDTIERPGRFAPAWGFGLGFEFK